MLARDMSAIHKERAICGRREIDRSLRDGSRASETGAQDELLEDRALLQEAPDQRIESAGRASRSPDTFLF